MNETYEVSGDFNDDDSSAMKALQPVEFNRQICVFSFWALNEKFSVSQAQRGTFALKK